MQNNKKSQSFYLIILGFFSFTGFLLILLFAFGFFNKEVSPVSNQPITRGTIGYETYLVPPVRSTTDYVAPEYLNQYKQSTSGILSKTTYYLYPSANLNTQRPIALIMLLHGAGRDGRSMIDKWKPLADKGNIILAAPNSKKGAWTNNDDIEVFRKITKDIEERIGTAINNKFAFGHSSGAAHIITLANNYPDEWCAVSANAGYPNPKSLPNYNEGGTPVQILLGTRDHIFNMDNALVVANHLSSHGHKVKFVKIPQHTHWYYAVGELINQKALSFFGTQDCRNR